MNLTFEITRPDLTDAEAESLNDALNKVTADCGSREQAWQKISKGVLRHYSFAIHLNVFKTLFPEWPDQLDQGPACIPEQACIKEANITQFMQRKGFNDLAQFHTWTTQNETFWLDMVATLPIKFKFFAGTLCDCTHLEKPRWFPNSKINIIDSCIDLDAKQPALIYLDENNSLRTMSHSNLDALVNRIANGLITQGFSVGDPIAIIMPMHQFAVAIYLAVIKIGAVVVSIADSFSSDEIITRLQIAQTKAIFTQDTIAWAGKIIPLYEKVRSDQAPTMIVLPLSLSVSATSSTVLRETDIWFNDFLSENQHYESVALDPMSPCNILFSSGTTATPKAIVWHHATAIKAASDGFFHQNIKLADVIAWPTNLGWMMGPWLVFAALINHATIALYPFAPKDEAFANFIEKARVTMLGVVPSLVASWRQNQCFEGKDLSAIKAFSSTGECSNPIDMLYLMSLANYQPIIEYCGGTEIGGAYVTSTVIQKNYPSLFSTPTMGTRIVLIDQQGKEADIGEVAIVPPIIGLSTQLLNADHQKVYYDNMPMWHDKILRRHGDLLKRYPNHYYALLGRTDDTMNLGGIKISAAEIERVMTDLPEVVEAAAVAISEVTNGPSLLVIFTVVQDKNLDRKKLMTNMQKQINEHLNPLFKIHDVVLMTELPKTASNKIMRRTLRSQYQHQE